MTDAAPKRIWADPPETFDGMDIWRSEPGGRGAEYVLASEHAALIREAEARGMERAAKLLDKRIDILINAYGSWESDTNVTNLPEWVETTTEELEAQAAAIRAAKDTTKTEQPLQARVKPWMDACFGEEISNDRLERGDRLLEEVFELLQSGDYPRDRIFALAAYVWSRDVGEPSQEVGGVMITLAAYCLAHGLNMHEAGEDELARIWTKVDVIRAKQAAKPKGSALPQTWPTP